MTVREMIDYVQTEVNSRRFWNDTRLINLINTVQNRIVGHFGVTVENYYTFSSVADQQRYLMPSDLISVALLYYDDGGRRQRIEIVNSPDKVYGNVVDPEESTYPELAYYWSVSGRKELWFYPLFSEDGITIEMWFYGLPPKLANDRDESALPVEWHQFIVDAVMNKVRLADEQITPAEDLMMFKDILREITSLDSTKQISERKSKFGTLDSFPRISGSMDNLGLIDGSELGIDWE